MKFKQKNRQGFEVVAPQVKLTHAEILADLVYPAPLFGREEDLAREDERSASH